MSEYSHPQFRKVKAMLGALSAQISFVPGIEEMGRAHACAPKIILNKANLTPSGDMTNCVT